MLGRRQPFQLQSRGIGLDYAKEHIEQMVDRGFTRQGRKLAIPRYYMKKLIIPGSPEEFYMQERSAKKNLKKLDQYAMTNEDLKDLVKSDNVRRSKEMSARRQMYKKSGL